MLTSPKNKEQYSISYPFAATFDITFKYWLAAEIHAVLSFPAASGKANQVLVLNVDFSLSAPGDTGTLTKLTDWDPDAIRLTIYRLLDIDQQTDYRNGEAVDMDLLEQDFDRATARMQQIDERYERTLLGPITDALPLSEIPVAAVRALQFLGFDAAGDTIVGQPVGAPATPWVQTLLDDMTLLEGQKTLGLIPSGASAAISSFIQSLLDDADLLASQKTLGLIPTGAGAVISAFIQSLLDDASAAAAQVTLGLREIALDNIIMRQTGITSQSWRDAAYSPSLGLIAMVSENGTTYRVLTSSDGVVWTLRTAAELTTWKGICWCPGIGKFIAVADTGTYQVMTSADGITWSPAIAAVVTTWQKVCWSEDKTLAVAVANSGLNRVMYSANGIAWTAAVAAQLNAWMDVAYSPTLGKFVAVSSDGTNRVMHSSDGATWQTGSIEASAWVRIKWVPELGKFFAGASGGTNRIAYSSDGINFTSVPITWGNWQGGFAWSPEWGQLLALSSGADTPAIITSTDGITWKPRLMYAAGRTYYTCLWVGPLNNFFLPAASSATDIFMPLWLRP